MLLGGWPTTWIRWNCTCSSSSGRSRPARRTEDRPELEAVWRAQVESRQLRLRRPLAAAARAAASTRSARPGTRATPPSPLALRPTDPALLHYRSGAFYLARAAQAGRDGVPRRPARRHRGARRADRRRPAQGVRPRRPGDHPADLDDRVASAPRGRRRVRDRARAASSASRARGRPTPIVVCSFGDASLNHATAQAALNSDRARASPGPAAAAAASSARTTGSGSACRTPPGWVEQALRARARARATCRRRRPTRRTCSRRRASSPTGSREHRRPAVLHLRTVRYLGHAGADVESAYRDAAGDPRRLRRATRCSRTGRLLAATAGWSGERLVRDYREHAARGCARSPTRPPRIPQLDSAAEIVARRSRRRSAPARRCAPAGRVPTASR